MDQTAREERSSSGLSLLRDSSPLQERALRNMLHSDVKEEMAGKPAKEWLLALSDFIDELVDFAKI